MKGAGKKPNTFMINGNGPPAPNSSVHVGARNLRKDQLGGVIFGCKNITFRECLSKQLFGLPAAHFTYVKNIDQGLPLFLFNYSDRKLYGIFEAASHGQLNIDPYGWTVGGSERTHYPAQVQVRVRQWCQPLLEEQFRPMIADNYYNRNHFWFELDHSQTNKLMFLLTSSAAAPSVLLPSSPPKWRTISQPNWPANTTEVHEGFKPLPLGVDLSDSTSAVPSLNGVKNEREGFKPPGFEVEHSHNSSRTSESSEFTPFDLLENYQDLRDMKQDELHLVMMKLEELAHEQKHERSSLKENAEDPTLMNNIKLGDTDSHEDDKEQKQMTKETTCSSSQCQSVMSLFIQNIEELKAFKTEHTLRMVSLEQKLVEAEREIKWLKAHCTMLESVSEHTVKPIEEKVIGTLDQPDLDTAESVLLVGGYDGESWLSTLDSYFPSHDMIKSLKPMNSVRSYASVAQLDGEIYVFGGGSGAEVENGYLWYGTVESYNRYHNQWTVRPSLNKKKGSLAGATINDKIFAVGGGNGLESFSDVEMLDLDIGRWIRTRSMLQKRFAVAAVEFNGALYATGGYDGNDYLSSAERFDPREHAWTKIASMSTKRGCHSLVVLNEKLYALGGFDGTSMVPTVEIFDPRLGSWMSGDSMNQSRGYAAAATLKDSIYVVGGIRGEDDIVDTVEIFKEGQGWLEKTSSAVQKRCFLSAITF